MPIRHLFHTILSRPPDRGDTIAMVQCSFDERTTYVTCGAEDDPGLLRWRICFARRVGCGGEVEAGIVGKEGFGGEDGGRGCHRDVSSSSMFEFGEENAGFEVGCECAWMLECGEGRFD
jgi:hypothetical protein